MSTVSQEPNKSQEELLEYWTEERRAKAQPKPKPVLPLPKEKPEPHAPPAGQEVVTPPNTSVEGTLKGGDSKAVAMATPVKTPAIWPYSCNGKLFFKWKGKDWVGSAGSIFLEILLTAAHNVYDEGEWSHDFVYYPGYPVYGKAWGWTRAAIFIAWRDKVNYGYDYSMILTSSSMKEVGSMGSVRSLSPVGRTWTAFGYPARAPYPGNQMYETTGSYVSGSGTNIIKMNNNDMTQGSSGGHWWTNYNGQNYVNGVNSFSYTGEPTCTNTPYLYDPDFKALLACAAYGQCH